MSLRSPAACHSVDLTTITGFAFLAAKDNTASTANSRAQQAASAGTASSTATAGVALAALLAGYLALLLPADFLATAATF